MNSQLNDTEVNHGNESVYLT